jgi:uncharacterized RDD family membrane protein YckC
MTIRVTLDLEKVEFASFPQRILARVIDSLIVFGLWMLYLKLTGVHLNLDVNSKDFDPNFGLGIAEIIFLPLFSLAYEVPSLAARGMTIGKRLMGICVVRTDGLIGIGLGRAMIRWCVPFFIGLFPLIGPILNIGAEGYFFFDPHRQNVPDKAARTYVVRIPKAASSDDVIDI